MLLVALGFGVGFGCTGPPAASSGPAEAIAGAFEDEDDDGASPILSRVTELVVASSSFRVLLSQHL